MSFARGMKSIPCLFILIFLSGTVCAGALTEVMPNWDASRHIACGVDHWDKNEKTGEDSTAIYKLCKPMFYFLGYPTSPNFFSLKVPDRKDWGWELPESPTSQQRLIYYILASFEAYGTLFHDVRQDINIASISYVFGATDHCEDYNRPGLYSSVTNEGDSEAYLLNRDMNDYQQAVPVSKACNSKFNHNISDGFLNFDSVKKINQIFSLLDRDFSDAIFRRQLLSLVLALESRRSDLTVDEVLALLSDQEGPKFYQDFWPLPTSFSLNNVQYELLESLVSTSAPLTAATANPNVVVFGNVLKNIPAINRVPTAEQLAKIPFAVPGFASQTVIAESIDINSQHLTTYGVNDDSIVLRNGGDLVLVANRISIGPENSAPQGWLSSLVSFPDLILESAAGRPYLSSKDKTRARSGRLLLVSPHISLRDSRLHQLRNVVSIFTPVLSLDDFGKISLSEKEISIITAHMDVGNPFIVAIRQRSNPGIDVTSFISYWENALTWQMRNDPQTILHRWLYVDPDAVFSDVRYIPYFFVPRGSRPQEVFASTLFDSRYFPPEALDRWALRWLQLLRAELNRALLAGDHLATLDVFRRIEILTSDALPISAKYADQINDGVAKLIADKSKAQNTVAVEPWSINLPGSPTKTLFVFNVGNTDSPQPAPSSAILEQKVFDGKAVIGTLTLVKDPVKKITLTFDVDLVTDSLTFDSIRSSLAKQARTLSKLPPSYILSVRPIPMIGVLATRSSFVKADSLHLEIDLDSDSATVFLVALNSAAGVPIVLDWAFPIDDSAKSERYEPISLSLSTRRQTMSPLTISGGNVVNPNPFAVDLYDAVSSVGTIIHFNPAMSIPAAASSAAPRNVIGDAEKFSPLMDTAEVPRASGNWLSAFYVTGESIVDTYIVKDQFLGDNKFGGAHLYSDIAVECLSGQTNTQLSLVRARLSPGQEQSYSCLRTENNSSALRVSGASFYENGGRQDFSPHIFQNLGVVLDRSIFPAAVGP